MESPDFLLQGASHVREDIIGVGTDQPDGADDDYKNHREHHRIFRDILSAFVSTEFVPKVL